MLLHPLAAEGQATRKLAIEDQKFGDLQRADLRPVKPAIGAVRRHRTQDRFPLHIVDRAADMRDRRQQQIIFDVEDARDVVGALEEGAELRELKAVVAQHRPVQRPAHLPVLAPDRREHVGQVVLAHLPLEQRAQRHPARIDRLPHLTGQIGARGAGIVARLLDDRQDARRIDRVAQHEIDDALRAIILTMRLPEPAVLPRGHQHRPPFGLGGVRPRQRDAEPRVDQAGVVLAPLQIARHPVKAAGGLA